ncbi:MAG: ABC transporter permease [Gaiellaceae bacterium]
MTASLRVFLFGGVLSYRALFAWIDPRVYIPSMLGFPLFQLLFFAYVGRAAEFRSDTFFIVGNGIQVANAGAIFGTAMTIGGERWTHTLSSVMATPANRFALFVGRALPNLVNGLLVSLFCFVAGWLLLDFDLAAAQVPALAVVVLVSTASCTALGLVVGAIGLRARDSILYGNLAYFGMLVFCGVNVPLDELPGWMAAIGRALPMTHGIEAGRELAAGGGLGDVAGLLAREGLIGSVYGVAAYGLFRLFEAEGRRRASFETS